MKTWGIGLMSNEEKNSILDQHKKLYDGYRTMQPKVSNTQPLYIQDFANDKGGITVNNRFEVKPYMNVGINEQVSKESMCSECGGMMYEGECSECGYKGEMGEEMQQVKDLKNFEDLNKENNFDYTEEEMSEDDAIDADALQNLTGQEAPHMADDMAPDGMDDDSDNDRKMMADGEMGETHQGNPYDNEQDAYNFVSGGPMQEDEFEEMTSAWNDDLEEITDEVEEDYLEEDYLEEEDDVEEEVEESHGDDLGGLDEDIRESVVKQKNKINEMFMRMKRF